MKKIVFVLVVTMSLSCTYLGSDNPGRELVGIWAFEDKTLGPLTLTFNKDQTFQVQSSKEGYDHITGKYYLSLGKLKLTDDDPRGKTECFESAFYDYEIEGKRIVFKEYADQCAPRRFILRHPMVNITLKKETRAGRVIPHGRKFNYAHIKS